MTSSKRLRAVFSWRLIGPLVVVCAIWWAGPGEVWRVLSEANPGFVVAALALAFPMAVLKGIRWKSLLTGQNVDVTLRESTSMYAMGMVMSAITPGRVGDFIKIVPLVRKGYSIGRAVAYNILDRVLDVAFIMLAGYAGMWYFHSYFASQLWMVNIILAGGVVAAAVLAMRSDVLEAVAIKLVPAKYKDAVRECWNEIVAGSLRNSLTRGAALIGMTAAFWPIQFLAVYFCALAVGADVSFLYMSACVAVATVISFVPITVAGAGTRDAVFILLLGRIGIERHESLAVSSLVLAVFVSNCVVFYLVSVLFKPPSAPTLADAKANATELSQETPPAP